MSPHLVQEIDAILEELASWKGNELIIEESISRNRNRPSGHDRHFATLSRFHLRLEYVGFAISGSAITLDGVSNGQPSLYQMTADNLVAVLRPDEGGLTFVEHFEQETERRSVIRPLREPATH